VPRADLSDTVTWLLPVKNGMPYLPATLASIEAQTHRRWDVLAWDNGSTDGTVEELRRWIPDRLPGRIVTERPLPLANSLREMVLATQTALCARIDADDISSPDRLQRQVDFLDRHADIALVGSRVQTIDETGTLKGSYPLLPCDHDDMLIYALHANPVAHPAVLFRREAVIQAGNYRNVGPVNVEDYDLWLRMAVSSRLANLPEPLLQYRIHERSATQQSLRANELQAALNERFCEHAPSLYGLSATDAMRLRTAKARCAFAAVCGIARHLARTQGGSAARRMLSPWLAPSAAQLTGSHDLLSRAAFKLMRSLIPAPK
jgi:glycosyltransferase involved in cell wall biosynthesis